jgi:hypothetical protein
MSLISRLSTRLSALSVFWLASLLPASLHAQERGIEDQTIDTIRRLSNISQIDRDAIRNWVQIQVDRLASTRAAARPPDRSEVAFKGFRQRFLDQYNHSENTSQFRSEFAMQTAAVAANRFGRPDLDNTVAWALAHALLDMQRQPETIPGLVAGLKAPAEIARYLCAQALANQRAAIGADKERLGQIVAALREAGVQESNDAVLGRIYDAMAYADQAGTVLEAYLAIFDVRLERRRSNSTGAAGNAEIAAFEFLRSERVLNALDANQKAEVVRRVAVFLRMDALRYVVPNLAPLQEESMPDLAYPEREAIERRLDAAEEILAAIAGERGGKIRDAFATGGYDERGTAVREMYKWVGNPETGDRGPLNDAPWNVPVGAP